MTSTATAHKWVSYLYSRDDRASAHAPTLKWLKLQHFVLFCIGLVLLIYYTTRANNYMTKPFKKMDNSIYDPANFQLPVPLPHDGNNTNGTLYNDDASPCSTRLPLVSVSFNGRIQRYVIRLHEERLNAYNAPDVECCYEAVNRDPNATDEGVKYDACVPFYTRDSVLSRNVDSIMVTCHIPPHRSNPIYVSGHAMIPEREDVRARIRRWQATDAAATGGKRRPLNVLLIGIGSVSRQKLARGLPATLRYLYSNGWYELSAYSMVGDKSYPNLLAVLSGYSENQRNPPIVNEALDKSPFIWQLFREHGYVTAYGEDTQSISPFKHENSNFGTPSTDYYLRSCLLTAEKRYGNGAYKYTRCLGPTHSAEQVYEYGLEFAQRFRNAPHFGFLWTNSRSHTSINKRTELDEKFPAYMRRLAKMGALEDTVVVFFSDHGSHFASVGRTMVNYFEVRLPFLFLWLPPSLRLAHPEFVQALRTNRHRLVSPYDLHMTLRHILTLSGRTTAPHPDEQPVADCAPCKSLFTSGSRNRSCADAGIPEEWCTFLPGQIVPKHWSAVRHVAQLMVDHMNSFVQTYKNGSISALCAKLRLGQIESAYQILRETHSREENIAYHIVLSTQPNDGLYEGTVHYNDVTDTIRLPSELTRLNWYNEDSACVTDSAVKKYCSCQKCGVS